MTSIDDVMTAISRQAKSETVAAYNARHAGKAWAIVAMTVNGGAYCAECAASWTVGPSGDDSPAPVFSSDDTDGMACEICFESI